MGLFSVHLDDGIHFNAGRGHTLSVRFCILPDRPMKTREIQMPPITSVAKLGCVREGWRCGIKVKGVHCSSQAQRWTKGWDTCISPHRNRAPERVIPAKTWGDYWIISDFCELCLSSLIWLPCHSLGSYPAHILHKIQGQWDWGNRE